MKLRALHANSSQRRRNILALIPILLFSLSTVAVADVDRIHLFIKPNPENDAGSAQASNEVESVLKTMLTKTFVGSTIKVVSPEQVTHPTVAGYARAFNISHYVEGEVSSTLGGLTMDFVLVAPNNRQMISTWLGTGKQHRRRAMWARLRGIPLRYNAMLNGIDPENLVFVRCFKAEIASLLQRTLTLQLPSSIAETDMKDRYQVSGVEPLDFDRHCLEPGGMTEEELDFEKDFAYTIEGFIQGLDNGVEVPILVHTKSGSENLRPLALNRATVAKDLAEHIARCWENWDGPGCR